MIVIPLPWKTPPTAANQALRSVNPHMRAASVRQVRAEAGWAIKAANIRPVVGADVTLHYRPKDRRRRDADGLFPTLKAVLDELVAQGVLPADDWVHVPSATCRIHPPTTEPPAIWVELDVLTEWETPA